MRLHSPEPYLHLGRKYRHAPLVELALLVPLVVLASLVSQDPGEPESQLEALVVRAGRASAERLFARIPAWVYRPLTWPRRAGFDVARVLPSA
jgi:hypothetical protein